jgi:hypothetical protein
VSVGSLGKKASGCYHTVPKTILRHFTINNEKAHGFWNSADPGFPTLKDIYYQSILKQNLKYENFVKRKN